MDAAELPLAGNCRRGAGRGCDGSVPSRVDALSGCGWALVLMLLTPLATFFYAQQQTGVADTAKSSPLAAALGPQRGQGRGEWRDSAVFLRAFFRRTFRDAPSLDALPWLVEAWLLGVASLVFVPRWIFAARTRTPQTVCCGQSSGSRDLLRAAGPDRPESRDRYCECAWLQAPQ